jgi:hypothetical protein
MRKLIFIMAFMITIGAFSQKKKNGTIYNEHPAIDIVENMQQALVTGDTLKLASYLADDFSGFNGVSTNKDSKGWKKKGMIGWSKYIQKNYDYVSLKRSNNAYPDALEYKDGESGLWVQTWDHFTAVHKETGVKVDMPVHRLYTVNEDNKITTMINYDNNGPFDEIEDSYGERENGTIYNHHEYINKVRRMMHAYEFGDLDTAYSFYADDARLRNIHMPSGESRTVEEAKEGFNRMLESWTIRSIDVRGYPDYLNYDIGDADVVMSWWTIRMTRKADDKKIDLPMMLIHYFNDDGMIVNEMGYYSAKMLEQK